MHVDVTQAWKSNLTRATVLMVPLLQKESAEKATSMDELADTERKKRRNHAV